MPLQALPIGKNTNAKLQNSYNKYGLESFTYRVLIKGPLDYIRSTEQLLIDTGTFYFNLSKLVGGGCPVGKPVSQYTLEGLHIKTFASQVEVCDAFKVDQGSLRDVFDGKFFTVRGYRWALGTFEETYRMPEVSILDIMKNDGDRFFKDCSYTIFKWSSSGELINTYTSAEQLSSELGINISRVRGYFILIN